MLFVLCFASANSQNLSGRIIDTDTQEPVAFTHVVLIDSTYGIIADINGSFQILEKYIGSKFIISAIGYESKELNFSKDLLSQPIYLSSMSYELKEVQITSSKHKRVWLNDFNNPSFGFWGIRNGGEGATFIQESEHYSQSQLLKVSVFVRNLGENSYLRLHVYNNNLLCSCPGTELLDSNYLINGSQKNSWIEIDVSASGVLIPENGIFVSVEGLRKSIEYVHDTVEVGCYSKPAKFGNYSYRKTLVGNWKSYKKITDIKVSNVINIALKIEVAYDKKQTKENRKAMSSDLNYTPFSKRKIKKLFDSCSVVSPTKYPNDSFENLLRSIYLAIENDDVPYLVNYLFVFDKESKESVYYELQSRKEAGQWFPDSEKEKVLTYWESILANIESAEFTKVDSDKFKVEFKGNKLAEIFVQTDGEKWKMYSNYSKVLRY